MLRRFAGWLMSLGPQCGDPNCSSCRIQPKRAKEREAKRPFECLIGWHVPCLRADREGRYYLGCKHCPFRFDGAGDS